MRVFVSEIIRIPNGTSRRELELTELLSRTNTDHTQRPLPRPSPPVFFPGGNEATLPELATGWHH